MRDERRLRLFENRVFRRIFTRKIGEVTGKWGDLHVEDLCNLYCSPDVVRGLKLRRMR
jgi:hypothetical protein